MYRTLNPATEEIVAEYPTLSFDEAMEKVCRAQEAFTAWRKTSFKDRKRLIYKMKDLLREKRDVLSALITQEMGKPITQAEIEIDKCGKGCEYYIEHAESFLKEEPIATEASKSYIGYDPLGVVLGIMPWNFPFWQVFRYTIPALLAGNVVLLKHAPNVPGCARAIEQLFEDAGFPSGVFQSLFLTNDDVARLIDSGKIQGVSVTGSDRAGTAVAAVAGRNLIKTVLELGGSDPFIVLEDADLAQAIPIAVKSRMLNAGQSCIAAKRFLVVEKVYAKFRDLFVSAVSKLQVGDPRKRTTEVGPLAREDLLVRLVKQIQDSVARGAKILAGSGRWEHKGFFYRPGVLEVDGADMPVCSEEVFGPVAVVRGVKNEDEAIQIANATTYGLGASLWTRDLKRGEALAREIQAGSVFVNGMVKSDPRLPFGGIKRSGYGRELSLFGLHEFMNIKTVWIG